MPCSRKGWFLPTLCGVALLATVATHGPPSPQPFSDMSAAAHSLAPGIPRSIAHMSADGRQRGKMTPSSRLRKPTSVGDLLRQKQGRNQAPSILTGEGLYSSQSTADEEDEEMQSVYSPAAARGDEYEEDFTVMDSHLDLAAGSQHQTFNVFRSLVPEPVFDVKGVGQKQGSATPMGKLPYHMGLSVRMSEEEEEERACGLLEAAREELQQLTVKWKEAEQRIIEAQKNSKGADNLKAAIESKEKAAAEALKDKEAALSEVTRLNEELQKASALAQRREIEMLDLRRELDDAREQKEEEEMEEEDYDDEGEGGGVVLAQGGGSMQEDELYLQIDALEEEREELIGTINSLHLRAQDSEEIHATLRRELKALHEAVAEAEAEREQGRERVLELEREASAIQDKYEEALETYRSQYDQKLYALKAQADEMAASGGGGGAAGGGGGSAASSAVLVEKLREVEARLEEASGRCGALERQRDRHAARASELQYALQRSETESAGSRAELMSTRDGFTREVMGLRGEVEALSAALRDERQEVSSLGSVRERLEKELEGERGEREAQCERVGRLEIELRGAVERAQEAQETLKERAGEIERLEERVVVLDETVSNSQRERESLTRQLSTARDEVERLRTLEADLAAARRDGEALTLEVRRLAANDEQLSASVRGGQERMRELEMELEAAKASEEEAQARINSAQGEIELLSRQVAEGTTKMSEAEAQIIALSGERDLATQRCEAMEKSMNGEKEAVKNAEREMAAAQARASHLMLQVQSLTSERDAAKNALSDRDAEHQRALGERDAAVEREREAKERAERGWEMERGERERERQDAVQQQQQQGLLHGHNNDAPSITPAADNRDQHDSILHSVIAQRTRGRISADSARGTPGRGMHSQTPGTAVSGVAPSSSIGRGEETRAASVQHSVIARRTRGRMAERENNFLLRHVAAVGQPPAQPVPAVVPLTHTGFVIGRCGADLELTSGYVSRKHAQLQRIAGGWRVLDTSTNGLCVNGYKVRSQQLQHGDILSFEVPQTVGFGQSVQPQWDERSHFRFRFCVEPIET